ncbi:cytochrome b [Paucibacter sp. B51]|uniref:cytochrome b n=1 Tax=Paucibacter sp. B51 TaxID=2993315 RepID=UPI0022EBC83F|nr:cytochrome b [Paucibacter sp. B51]
MNPQAIHEHNSAPLSAPTRALHWILALAMIGLTAVGLYMAEFEAWALYPIHKSIGLLVLPLALARAAWRLKEGWPPAASPATALEQTLAKAVHGLLLLCTLAMPISGMTFSGASGHGFGIFGLTLMHHNEDPQRPGQVLPLHEGLSQLAQSVHSALGYLLIALLLLHVAGALKHHLLDRDATLLRMLGRSER